MPAVPVQTTASVKGSAPANKSPALCSVQCAVKPRVLAKGDFHTCHLVQFVRRQPCLRKDEALCHSDTYALFHQQAVLVSRL